MTPGIDLTPQDAERLRQILDAYQAKNPQRMQEFDLAKPPTPPYRHQEYPKVMYHHGTARHKQAKNAQEEAEAVAAGCSTKPVPVEEPEIQVELSPEEAALIAEAEAANPAAPVAEKPKAKRGPKPKTPKAE